MTESMALSIAEWLVSSIAYNFALAVAEIGSYSESNCYQLEVQRSAHVKIWNLKLKHILKVSRSYRSSPAKSLA